MDVENLYDEPLKLCPLCGSGQILAYDRDFRGHSIWLCGACGTKFMNPRRSDSSLAKYYSGYIVPESPERIAWRRRQKELHFDVLMRFVKGGRCLCVGCGDGMELVLARERGFDVEGYDVDPATTSRVMQATGVRVHTGDFPALPVPDHSFDCVYMDQVLEHPKNPAQYLHKACSILKPGGVLYLGLPNISSLSGIWKTTLGKLGLKTRSRGKHYGTEHHHFYYAPWQLARLLDKCYGMEVMLVAGDPAPGTGRLAAWFQRRIPALGSTFIIIARTVSPVRERL